MMKAGDVQTTSTIAPVQKDEPPLPWWYRPVKWLFLVFGGITVVLELIMLSGWLIALHAQRPSLSISSPILPLFLWFFVGIIEIYLWMRSKSFLFSTHSSPPSQEEEAHLSKGSTNVTQSDDLAPAATPDRGNGIPGNTEQFGPLKVTPHTTGNSTEVTTITHPETVTDSFAIIPPKIGLSVQSGTSIQIQVGRVSSYAVAREGNNLALSADKKACNEQGTRYALADGVGTSFLPGRWAKIVTDTFVKRDHDFQGQEDFEGWLRNCSRDWLGWVNEEWLPEARKRSGQADWSREIERGASTTLVGCSFSWDELRQKGETNVHVTAVGDAVFFLVSPSPNQSGRWEHISYFLKNADDFGQMTETLGSPERRIPRDWKRVHQDDFLARRTDTLVLATDALAQWIMRYKEAGGDDPWYTLFTLANISQFAEFVDHYRAIGAMEVDDTTAFIIPLRDDGMSTKSK